MVDGRGRPMTGVTVRLLDSALAAVDSAGADSSGTFYLTARTAGKYLLRVTAVGLQPVDTRAFSLLAGDFHQERIALTAVPNPRVYLGNEVQEPVTPFPGNRPPTYPVALRAQHLPGQVLLQFVVDTTGRPVLGSAKVLRSTDEEFTKAVLAALPSYRFHPARIGGHAVAQMVQMPFDFTLLP